MSKKSAIINKIKEIEGNLVLIGIYDELAFKAVEDNEKLTGCMIINNNKFSYGDLENKKGRIKHYNIKKIRKTFKKKTVHNIIGSYEELKNKMHHFIKNSIYITNGMLYIYCNRDDDTDELIRRYKRYNTKVKEIDEEDFKVIEINIGNAKNKRIKDFFYTISDLIYIATDFIGDILTS